MVKKSVKKFELSIAEYIRKNTLIVFLSILAFLAIAVYHLVYWLLIPYPNDFREGAGVHVSYLFTEGFNPFSDQSPTNSFYMYGFVMPLLASLYERIFGYDGYFPLRLIALLSNIGCACIIEVIVRKITSKQFPGGLAFCLMIPTGWICTELLGRPDTLGLFLALAAVTFFSLGKSFLSNLIAAVSLILVFYTKQYFILLSIPIFFGGLFINAKRAFQLALLSSMLMLFSIPLVNLISPFYFPMSILTYGETLMSLGRLVYQIQDFSLLFWPLIIMVMFGGYSMFFKSEFRFNRNFTSGGPVFVLKTKNGDDTCPQIIFWTILLVINSIFILWLGQNVGAFRSYFLQLLLPPLIVCAAFFYDKMKDTLHGGHWFPIVVSVVCLLIPARGAYFSHPFKPKETQAWVECLALLEPKSGRILLQAPVFVHEALKYNISDFQNGLFAVDWLDAAQNKVNSVHPFIEKLFFASTPDLISRCNSFVEKCHQKISDKEYSKVVTCSPSEIELGLLKQAGYQKIREFILRTGTTQWPIDIWVLNENLTEPDIDIPDSN